MILTPLAELQKRGNMKYKTQSEIQVLCQKEGKASFSLMIMQIQ